ncbi:MAG: hypothetical protein HFJ55_06790 [Clostridia bacterium]|nr:hypothetical protein [Clostridia bacterium]
MITSKLPGFIYQGRDIPEVIRLYEKSLRNGNFDDIAHANALRLYHDLITDHQFIGSLQRAFTDIYCTLEREKPNLNFSIEGRRKSLISTEQKICMLLNDNKSLDWFRDAFAFRFVIFGMNNDPYQQIDSCYEVMNRIIYYYVSNGCTLCEEPVPSLALTPSCDLYNRLVVPDKSKVEEKFRYGVKDYIFNPKANGYQSLHCALRTQAGYCFEVQIRSLAMHVFATNDIAAHHSYKKTRYSDFIQFDRNLVNIPGYAVDYDNTVFDFVGLEKPLSIFNLSKTF